MNTQAFKWAKELSTLSLINRQMMLIPDTVLPGPRFGRYFQEEINYMQGQIDTLTESIKKADTTRKFGILARCYYQVSKNGKYKADAIYYFIRNNGYILNDEMLDSFIARSYKDVK